MNANRLFIYFFLTCAAVSGASAQDYPEAPYGVDAISLDIPSAQLKTQPRTSS